MAHFHMPGVALLALIGVTTVAVAQKMDLKQRHGELESRVSRRDTSQGAWGGELELAST